MHEAIAQRGRWMRQRSAKLEAALAEGLAAIHDCGLIHRDLKPSNVMVGSFGEVQVMDWGLAKVLPRGGVSDDEKAGKDDRQETVIATASAASAPSRTIVHPVSGSGVAKQPQLIFMCSR